ncbi:membrane-associated guanylate kinase [Triplophysa rosa]|uniref:Membrane-associated guanylate kinase n=1 Tax=Triplophysa rosa TaxID=992332 RepID=A0A9W8C581_TRIRA|nr:membrane-associated guanylate kinase [Triplophysa rosa]
MMSKTLKRKKHWSTKVQECAVSWGSVGEFGDVVEILGGAELGEFPFLGQMNLDVLVCHVGRLPYYGDVLLEVNGTPVSGLTNRDTHAVIRHFREPIRIKTVKPGERRKLYFLALKNLDYNNIVSVWRDFGKVLVRTRARIWL